MPPQTITVTLFVDTNKINIGNMDQSCNFGQDVTKISNCDYTVEAEPKDVIIWQATPMQTAPSTTDTVKIIAIWCQTDRPGNSKKTNVMGPFSRRSNTDLAVVSTVVGKHGETTEYKLFFQVNKNGVPHGIYFVDPKIAIKPRS